MRTARVRQGVRRHARPLGEKTRVHTTITWPLRHFCTCLHLPAMPAHLVFFHQDERAGPLVRQPQELRR